MILAAMGKMRNFFIVFQPVSLFALLSQCDRGEVTFVHLLRMIINIIFCLRLIRV